MLVYEIHINKTGDRDIKCFTPYFQFKNKNNIYITLHLSIYIALTEKAVRNDGLGVN